MIRSIHAGTKQTGGFSLNVFTDDELEDVHLATLEVLEKTGLSFDDDEALEILDGSGAKIDKKNRKPIRALADLVGGRGPRQQQHQIGVFGARGPYLLAAYAIMIPIANGATGPNRNACGYSRIHPA